jgi:chorismate synthase
MELGGIKAKAFDPDGAQDRAFGSPDEDAVAAMEERVKAVRAAGDTLGGVVEIKASGLPAGLGEPVFDKLDARLAAACMSVGAVKAVEIGAGAQVSRLLGSQNNDLMTEDGFLSNNAGGVLAGVSSGQEIVVRAHVKPIPSIAREQRTMTSRGEPTIIAIGGRHDIAAIPRINPVLKAMVLLTLADFWLLQKAQV